MGWIDTELVLIAPRGDDVAHHPLVLDLCTRAGSPDWACRALQGTRDWLMPNARTVAIVIILLLAAALLRNGIAGLVN